MNFGEFLPWPRLGREGLSEDKPEGNEPKIQGGSVA
jgi:hypothetical protein